MVPLYGANEANPPMGGLVDHPAAFVAVMSVLNSLYAAIVANNYRVIHQMR